MGFFLIFIINTKCSVNPYQMANTSIDVHLIVQSKYEHFPFSLVTF